MENLKLVTNLYKYRVCDIIIAQQFGEKCDYTCLLSSVKCLQKLNVLNLLRFRI